MALTGLQAKYREQEFSKEIHSTLLCKILPFLMLSQFHRILGRQKGKKLKFMLREQGTDLGMATRQVERLFMSNWVELSNC